MTALAVASAANDGDLAAWQSFVEAHPHATVYHLPAWQRIFAEGLGYRAWLLMARRADTGAVQGVLQLFHVRTALANRLVAIPFRDRGGPLWNNDDAFLALMQEAKRLMAESGASQLILKSVSGFPPALVRTAGLTERLYWIRSELSLGGRTETSYWQDIGSKTRNMVRQAEQAGLRCEQVSDVAGVGDDWYRLHLLSQRRLGLPAFPRRFFAVMLDELRRAGAIAPFVVRDGAGRAAAATLVLIHRRAAIYGYSASDPSFHDKRANDLLLFRVIEWLLRGEYAVFDLGSDSPSQQSLLFFKRKWGATQRAIPMYTLPASGREPIDSSAPRYAAARALVRMLPLPVLAGMSRLATRHLGG